MTNALAISASLACFGQRAPAGHCCAINLAGCSRRSPCKYAAGRGGIRSLTSVLQANTECDRTARERSSPKDASTIPIDPRTDPAVSSLEA